jgi:putative transposase
MKNRKSIRLGGYDYSSDGWYFITICSFEFEEIFGIVNNDGVFIPNEIGKIVIQEWQKTVEIRKNVYIDDFQLMPNHFHGIIILGSKENMPNVGLFPKVNTELTKFESPKANIGAIIRGFKGAVTKKTSDFIENKIWQRNYYERIIRDEIELLKIRKYIKNNPKNWKKDKDEFKKLIQKMNEK